ncbi:hypothetical protein TorRG33x02_171380 [Trema orientale]|uniref:Uncharacterized protein n=1 Tax=Trema orientale TaxID=63057 RepID=A0A2P5ENI2_TREOI|nr:hypothetical protein TorRG33x02_171380 [Trema orientale]
MELPSPTTVVSDKIGLVIEFEEAAAAAGEEVVEEILLRATADTLKNCNPSFVNKHLLRVTVENSKPWSSSKSSSRTVFLKWVRQELSLEEVLSPYPLYSKLGNDLSKLELSLITSLPARMVATATNFLVL